MYTRISEGFGTMKNTYKHSNRVLLGYLQYPTLPIFMCNAQEHTYGVGMYVFLCLLLFLYPLCDSFDNNSKK